MKKQLPKLLIMVDWFYPGYKAGGPIRSSLNVAFALKDAYDIYVLTTDTDHGESKPYEDIPNNSWVCNLDENIKVYYAEKKLLSFTKLRKVILAVNPEYIYLNHIWSPFFVLYPLWLKYSRQVQSKLIVCPRGALYDSALAVKPYKKMPLLKVLKWMGIHKHIVFHATNDREMGAIQTYFKGSEVIIADNLPTSNQPKFISCFKKPGSVKCIFIARIVPIKNLLFLLNVLEKVKAQVSLTVVGPAEDGKYWDECKKKIEILPKNISVKCEGPKHNDELQPILQQHHLFILPTTGENFGHSIFEALLVGRPVLISDQTPWLDLQVKGIGWDVPLQQPEAFLKIIEEIAEWDQQSLDETCCAAWDYARAYIESPVVKERYLQLFS